MTDYYFTKEEREAILSCTFLSSILWASIDGRLCPAAALACVSRGIEPTFEAAINDPLVLRPDGLRPCNAGTLSRSMYAKLEDVAADIGLDYEMDVLALWEDDREAEAFANLKLIAEVELIAVAEQ